MFLRDVRPPAEKGYEVRFETAPGEQAQVDFAQFQVVFADEPSQTRVVWLFSMVLGCSRLIWARFVAHQDLATVLRCHVGTFEAMGGCPREILYDRMKTAVVGEGDLGIVYNRSLIDLARHYGFHPKACRTYSAQTKGKVERPFRYIREDFFRARSSFRNLEDLNAQLRVWLDQVANPRVHATTRRVVNEAFAEERPHHRQLPLAPFRAVLRLERRISRDGMVSVGGNFYSVPDATRRRVVEVHTLANEVQIFEDGSLVAAHPVLEGRHQRRVAPGHRKAIITKRSRGVQSDVVLGRNGDVVAQRSLEVYDAVARRLAQGRPGVSASLDLSQNMLDRIRHDLVGLKMPRALEALDQIVRRLKHGEVSALEAIDMLPLRGADASGEQPDQDRAAHGAGSARSRPWPASTSPSSHPWIGTAS